MNYQRESQTETLWNSLLRSGLLAIYDYLILAPLLRFQKGFISKGG
jgi:hypothetical protein